MRARDAAPPRDDALPVAAPLDDADETDVEETARTTRDEIDLATHARIWRVDGRILETRAIRV